MKFTKFLSIAVLGLLISCGNFAESQQAEEITEAAQREEAPELVAMETQTNQNQMEMSEQDPQKTDAVQVLMVTSMGEITIELDRARAPITVENFLSYVDDGHYNGTIFHRVIPNFMIQGGGFTSDGTQKETKAPIVLESQNGLSNAVGTIAMARTNVPNSATSQFFINVQDNKALDYRPGNPGYAVFGKVISGMDVVNAIRQVPTGNFNRHADWPKEPVVIESVTRVEN